MFSCDLLNCVLKMHILKSLLWGPVDHRGTIQVERAEPMA